MGIAGGVSQQAANTAFLAKGQEIFSKKQDGQWRLLVDEVNGFKGGYIEGGTLGASPSVNEITGNRPTRDVRAYSRIARTKTYGPDAVEFRRTEVEQDVSGRITAFLQNYLVANAAFWDKVVIDLFLTNPTGMDGVSLLNDSHPYAVNAGTWDNKVTDALSQSALRTGVAAIESLNDEYGQPMKLSPTHLIVGPDLRQLALDLTGAMRPMAVGTSSSIDGVAGGAVYAENWLKGQLIVVVEPRFADGTHDNDWVIADLSGRAGKPFLFGEAKAPFPVVVDDPQSEPMRQRSSYAYYIEGDAAILPYSPFGLYGKLS